MTAPIAYGIDFGTTNSSLAIAYEDRVETLLIDPSAQLSACLPSMMYLHRGGDTSAGRVALERFARTGNQQTGCNRCEFVIRNSFGTYSDCKQYSSGKGCLDARIISELKTELTSDIIRTHSWAKDYELSDLISIVLKDLKKRATGSHPGHEVDKVVLGHPITFFGASGPNSDTLNDRALDRLYDGARRAGFQDIEFYPEPNAAVLDEELEDGITIAVDFGGGTFDIIVVDIQDGEGNVVSSQGAAIGGTIFDGLIFDHKLASYLGLNDEIGPRGLPIPPWFTKGLRSLRAFRHLLTNSETLGIVTDLKRANPRAGKMVEDIIFGGQAPTFFSAIETAKIALSDNDSSLIEYYSPYSSELSFRLPLLREEFNQWIAPHLEVIKDTIVKAMDEAEVSVVPDQVNTIIRTGGSSSLPAFVEMLDQIFGAQKIRSRDAFLSVAYGLGVYAQEIWS